MSCGDNFINASQGAHNNQEIPDQLDRMIDEKAVWISLTKSGLKTHARNKVQWFDLIRNSRGGATFKSLYQSISALVLTGLTMEENGENIFMIFAELSYGKLTSLQHVRRLKG